jgi:hypothetical protein
LTGELAGADDRLVAKLGVAVMVPPFIDVGEWVRVDVESGRYVERAKAKGR